MRVVSDAPWQDAAPYAFCLALSLSKAYPAWWQAFGHDFGPQGKLFEDLTAEAVAATFTGWEVHQTGWSATEPNHIATVVRNVAELIGEVTERSGGGQRNAQRKRDSTCFALSRSQTIARASRSCCSSAPAAKIGSLSSISPSFASGTRSSLSRSILKKALAMPFALDANDFRNHANIVNGLLLDRDRLLAPGRANGNWTSANPPRPHSGVGRAADRGPAAHSLTHLPVDVEIALCANGCSLGSRHPVF